MYYVPDIENAWQSVYYLQYEVAYGKIIRSMHHWERACDRDDVFAYAACIFKAPIKTLVN